jgi:ribosomal protein S18 acetylase RimI-like enzyme
MIRIKPVYKEKDFKPETNRKDFVSFMFKYIENYGDSKELIDKSVDYALSENKTMGGMVLIALEKNMLIGGSIVLNTGMVDYIPENLLVYGAVHKDFRMRGIIRKLIEKHFELSPGDFKMHIDLNNPAVDYFENLGFEKKYFDLRYKR